MQPTADPYFHSNCNSIVTVKCNSNSLTPNMGYADFSFQLNLLPPYSLRSQGDKDGSLQHITKNHKHVY